MRHDVQLETLRASQTTLADRTASYETIKRDLEKRLSDTDDSRRRDLADCKALRDGMSEQLAHANKRTADAEKETKWTLTMMREREETLRQSSAESLQAATKQLKSVQATAEQSVRPSFSLM
jgi:hypothetical protein